MKWFVNKQTTLQRKFKTWIDQYHAALYKHALWMTGNQDLAMDMVQETYFQAWSSLKTLKDDAKAFAWLMTILRRAICREQRYQYRHQETMDALQFMDQQNSADSAYSLMDCYSILQSISVVQREALLLFELHGFSYQEISQQLNLPMGTVMSRIARAREAFKTMQSREAGNIIKLHHLKQGEG